MLSSYIYDHVQQCAAFLVHVKLKLRPGYIFFFGFRTIVHACKLRSYTNAWFLSIYVDMQIYTAEKACACGNSNIAWFYPKTQSYDWKSRIKDYMGTWCKAFVYREVKGDPHWIYLIIIFPYSRLILMWGLATFPQASCRNCKSCIQNKSDFLWENQSYCLFEKSRF